MREEFTTHVTIRLVLDSQSHEGILALSLWYVRKEHACKEALCCSSKQTDIAPKIFMLCSPRSTSSFVFACEVWPRIQTSTARTSLCMSVSHGASHFYKPSDLHSQKTICFSKLITWIFWCLSFSQYPFSLPPTLVLQQALSL
jgi:hypothetical protein